MGKKDYQLFADAISLIEDKDNRIEITLFLKNVFEQDNPNFSIHRFEEWVKRRRNKESMKGTKYNPKYMPLGNDIKPKSISLRAVSIKEIKSCPSLRLDAQHYLPTHKTEECKEIK